MLSVQIGYQKRFVRFLESDGFETEVCLGWVEASDEVCGLCDFGRSYWAERMGSNVLEWCGHWRV